MASKFEFGKKILRGQGGGLLIYRESRATTYLINDKFPSFHLVVFLGNLEFLVRSNDFSLVGWRGG